MADGKHRVLFLCTGNSARSLMAEAIANQTYGKSLEALSAGSKPTGAPNPLTLDVLTRNGLSTEGLRSKSVEEYRNHPFDLVLTLCDGARGDPCPVFPGSPPHVHWVLPDPAASETSVLFEAVFDVLVEAIGLTVNAPDPSLRQRAAEAGREVSRRFSPRAI